MHVLPDENRPLLRENGARSRSGSQRDSRRVNGNDRMVAGINYHKENINGHVVEISYISPAYMI